MALYDEYFRNEDKPFAENLNDALLLSNVFDLTVGIEMPKMFSNSEWVNTTSPRKCSVAICTLKEGLPSGVTVGTDSQTGKSILSGTGTVKLSFYPNFNSFGSYDSISWENDGNIVVNLKTASGTTIANNINKGDVESHSSELKTLQEIVIEIVFTNATLYSFDIVMSNKEQERYGATVGITDVTGLDDRLAQMDNLIQSLAGIIDDITDKDDTNIFIPLNTQNGFVKGTLKASIRNKVCQIFADLVTTRAVTAGDSPVIAYLEFTDNNEEFDLSPLEPMIFNVHTDDGKVIKVAAGGHILYLSNRLYLSNVPALSTGTKFAFSCTYILD